MVDEPQFISEPHTSFIVRAECTACGWTWEGWAEGADDARQAHTAETARGN